MAEQIIADTQKLLELDDILKNSITQLDSVYSEHGATIRKTKNRIVVVLDVWNEKKQKAYDKLLIAQENLRRAEEIAMMSENGTVPFYYYQAVDLAKQEYDRISQVCKKIESIYYDFTSNADSHCSAFETKFQNYTSVINNGSYVLNQYVQLINKSKQEINLGQINSSSFQRPEPQIDEPPSGRTVFLGNGKLPDSCEFLPELSMTQQIWVATQDGGLVYDSPIETGSQLDSNQGKVEGFLGTCGLVSCVNVLRLAGYPATEKEVVEYASKTPKGFMQGTLCTICSAPEENGGTSAKSRQQILEHFGLKSELREASVENIADAVSEGRGVILSVFAGMLYYGRSDFHDSHAITITSVKKDKYGNVLGFYVCDSGTGGVDGAHFYTAYQIENALTGRQMNVTGIIR